MNPWRTYADPPDSDPSVGRDQRKATARALRDDVDFDMALADNATGFVVWMCADALDLADGPRGPVVDAVNVDDVLPGPWEADLLDLARRRSLTGRAAEAMAEAYQRAVVALAMEPLHASRVEALRRSRGLADGMEASAAQSAATAARRLVSPGARLRRDRVGDRWGCAVEEAPDLGAELAQYRESLPEPTSRLLAQYRVADALAGDTGCLLVLMSRGSDGDDVVLLEATPARESSREAEFGAWREGSDVQRVLLAREAVPLVPAEFAGWSTSADGMTSRVWSRARGAKSRPDWGGKRATARRLGAALGLLHASSTDAASLAGYLGHSGRFLTAVRDAADPG